MEYDQSQKFKEKRDDKVNHEIQNKTIIFKEKNLQTIKLEHVFEDIWNEAINITLEIEEKIKKKDYNSLKKTDINLPVIDWYWELFFQDNNEFLIKDISTKIVFFRSFSITNLYYFNWAFQYKDYIINNIRSPFLIDAKTFISSIFMNFLEKELRSFGEKEFYLYSEYLIRSWIDLTIERAKGLEVFKILINTIFSSNILKKIDKKYNYYNFIEYNNEEKTFTKKNIRSIKENQQSNKEIDQKPSYTTHKINEEIQLKFLKRIQDLMIDIVEFNFNDDKIRIVALECLSKIKSEKTKEICLSLINNNSESDIVKSSAIITLGKIRDYESLFIILSEIYSNSAPIWLAAIDSLDYLIEEKAKKIEIIYKKNKISRSFYYFALEELLEIYIQVPDETNKKDTLLNFFLKRDLVGLISVCQKKYYKVLKDMILKQGHWNFNIISFIASNSDNEKLKKTLDEILDKVDPSRAPSIQLDFVR